MDNKSARDRIAQRLCGLTDGDEIRSIAFEDRESGGVDIHVTTATGKLDKATEAAIRKVANMEAINVFDIKVHKEQAAT